MLYTYNNNDDKAASLHLSELANVQISQKLIREGLALFDIL